MGLIDDFLAIISEWVEFIPFVLGVGSMVGGVFQLVFFVLSSWTEWYIKILSVLFLGFLEFLGIWILKEYSH